MGRIEYEYPLFKVYYSNNSNNSNIRGNPGVEEMEEEDAGPGDGDTGHRQSGPVICPPPGQLVTGYTDKHSALLWDPDI